MSALVTHPVAKVPFPEVKIHHFQLHEVVCRLRLSCCSPGIRLFPLKKQEQQSQVPEKRFLVVHENKHVY